MYVLLQSINKIEFRLIRISRWNIFEQLKSLIGRQEIIIYISKRIGSLNVLTKISFYSNDEIMFRTIKISFIIDTRK